MDACDLAYEQSSHHDQMCIQAHQAMLKSQSIKYTDINGERYCEDCGGIIPAKRVIAVPHTTRCIQCQTAFESDSQ